MKYIKDEKLRRNVKIIIDVIEQSTPEERIKLADEIHGLYEKMESKGGKELIEDLENFARYGFLKINIQQKPTSGATEVSR